MKIIRRIIGLAVVLAILLSISITVFAFSDNESRSVESFFAESEMLKGDGKSYALDKESSRMEGMIILIRILGKEAEAQEMSNLPCKFIDVPNWAVGYVNYAYETNISKGVGGNLFGTNNKITAKEFNTLLLRVLGYDDANGDFQWNDSVTKTDELAILPTDMVEKYNKNSKYTKRDLVETAFCFLEANYKDQEETMIHRLIETGVVTKETAEKYGLAVMGWDTITTTLSESDFLKFSINQNQLYIEGTNDDHNKEWLLARIADVRNGAEKTRKVVRKNSQGEYDITFSLASLPVGEYYVDLYVNKEKYNYYTSIIFETVRLIKNQETSYFLAAPVYGKNLRIFMGNQLEEEDYKMTLMTRASKESLNTIRDLAFEITEGIEGDYDKVEAIHDWVADNIYYDKDFLNGKAKTTNLNSIDVLKNKYGVCSGYSNLTKDLVSALGIPNKQVLGYGLGIQDVDSWDDVDLRTIQPNHIWNEVYVDGRWIVIDATWDSANTYEAGTFTYKGIGAKTYFDTTIQFFSNSHKTD